MKKKRIPKEVLRIQEEYGFNQSVLVSEKDAKQIYSLYLVDGNGRPVPTGLPFFVVLKDGIYKTVNGQEAHELSASLSIIKA